MEVAVSEEMLKPIVENIVSDLIARFVQENELRARELSLMERVVRVEEELKALHQILMGMEKVNQQRFESLQQQVIALQREMDKRFETIEKANQQRFEAIDKRFETIDKRLNFLQWLISIGFTFLAVLITTVNFLAK